MTTDVPTTPRSGVQQVGWFKSLAANASVMRHGMNLWPPFLCSGIRVEHLSDDYRRARVRLRSTSLTSNYVGTLFGGSLFAMTDPFWMFMIIRNIGRGYVVWDKAAQIDFVSPGRGSATASFELTEDVLVELREAAADGRKVLRWFSTDVIGSDGAVIARVRKQIYVREKPPTPS